MMRYYRNLFLLFVRALIFVCFNKNKYGKGKKKVYSSCTYWFFFVAHLYDSNVQKGAVHSYGQRGEQHDDRANQELEEHGERGDGVPAWHEPRLPRYERP